MDNVVPAKDARLDLALAFGLTVVSFAASFNGYPGGLVTGVVGGWFAWRAAWQKKNSVGWIALGVNVVAVIGFFLLRYALAVTIFP